MDGYELTPRLRAQWPEVQLVAITGKARRAIGKGRAMRGFHGHLTHPVNIEKLANLLTNLSGETK